MMKLARCGLITCLLLLANASHGLDFDIVAGYEASYSTNADRVAEDESQQWIHEPSVAVGLTHSSSNLALDSEYSAERRMYQQDSGGRFGDESIVTGTTTLAWQAIPQRLEVGVDHYRTEATIDAAGASGPRNRQESQEATATVAFRQPIAGNQFLRIASASSVNTYEVTDNDAKIQEFSLAYVMPFSEARGMEIFARHADTRFDDFGEFDYELQTGGVLFYSQAPTGALNIELGYSKTDPDSTAIESLSGLTGSIEFQQGISEPFQWGISLLKEYTDRSAVLDRGTISIETDPELLDTDASEVYESTQAALDFIFRSGSNTYSLEVAIDDQDRQRSSRDQNSERLSIVFDRRIRENLSFRSSASYSEFDFDEFDRSDELFVGQMLLQWDLSRRLQLTGSVTFRERQSSELTGNYTEWVGAVAIRYVVRPSRT